MRPVHLAKVVGVLALATLANACADLEPDAAGLATSQSSIGLPPADCTDDNSPLVCGWENGAPDWFNLFQTSSQSQWLNQPSPPAVLEGWEKPWANDWEGVGTNSYAIGWTRIFGASWPSWSFDANAFAWALRQGPSTTAFAGNGCTHPTTRTGASLGRANGTMCNGVVAAVCAQRASCCAMRQIPLPVATQGAVGGGFVSLPVPGAWDATCVSLAVSLGEAGGGAHAVLDTGIDLPAYDRIRLPVLQPKLGANLVGVGGIGTGAFTEPANLCARKVCETIGPNDGRPYGYCCTTRWDEACVAQAYDVCSARFTDNTRVEKDPETGVSRVFADVCYEATVPGFNRCPVDRTQRNGGQECCRRALVLEGVYRAIDTTRAYEPSDTAHYGHGRLIDWMFTDSVRLDRSLVTPLYDVNATLALDNCYTIAGSRVCSRRKHKLWQAAGPGGPLYPDYPMYPASADLAPDGCEGDHSGKPLAERCTDWSHAHRGFRGILMAAISALITTDAPHDIDIQWRPDKYYDSNGEPMPYSEHTLDPFVDEYPQYPMNYASFDTWEGNWGTERVTAEHLVTSASCYGWNAPQRAHGELVENIPVCDPHAPVGTIQSLFNVPPVLSPN